jgi:hypothetical protein
MKFKAFISRQRLAIFIVGLAVFILSIIISNLSGFASLWGELFVDLAASSVTIIFTALIIDYLSLKEQSNKTKNAASLANEEIKASCFRIKTSLAWLFGLERRNIDLDRDDISSISDVRDYLESASKIVDDYLSEHSLTDKNTPIDKKALPRYIDRLQSAQSDLEQTLILYEFAMPLNIREQVLKLRRELQLSERLVGFIDDYDSLSESNISMIRVTAQSVYGSLKETLSLL